MNQYTFQLKYNLCFNQLSLKEDVKMIQAVFDFCTDCIWHVCFAHSGLANALVTR